VSRRVEPQFDHRLIGVWSRDYLNTPRSATDTRILFKSDFTGRYETWHHGLSEVITFNWSPPEADRVTMAGLEYIFREPPNVRREPCDWHFEAVPYSIGMERMADGETHVLRLRFGNRVDVFALMSSDLAGFEKLAFD
jgi:hypothetical protein